MFWFVFVFVIVYVLGYAYSSHITFIIHSHYPVFVAFVFPMPTGVAKKPRMPLCERSVELLWLFAIMCWMVQQTSGICTRHLVSRIDFAQTWMYWLKRVKAWRRVDRAERDALRNDRPVLCRMIAGSCG